MIDALVQQGIPREQIVLAYANESVPDSERESFGSKSESKFPVSRVFWRMLPKLCQTP